MKILKNNWQLILFNIVILLTFIIGYGHFGDIMVDSFREAYIPSEVIKGQVLYKNIFTIYAPFSYLFNALLFKIFGVHLSVLYLAGLFSTFGILNLVFAIANRFMNKTYSLSIILFIISVSVLSPNVFNFYFPYSYGILYGVLFILASIYFALKDKFPLSYLMYSFAICSKYEFILLLPLLFYVTRTKDLLKNIIALVAPFIVTYAPLFIMGVRLENIVTSFQIILSMSTTKTIYWFYSIMGLTFRIELIPIYLVNLLKVAIPLFVLSYIKRWWVIVLTVIYFYFIVTPELFIYAFPLILILLIRKFSSIKSEKLFFVLASLLVSMKIFFSETFMSYGVFFLPFALISIFILIPPKFKKSFFIVLLACALNFGIQNSKSLMSKNIKINTNKGIVYTSEKSVKDTIDYIMDNTSLNDRIVVFPECLAINFMTSRMSDNKFYSLIPLYVETFGEDLIVKRLDFIKPKYIIISNYDTSNYYYHLFGQDYAGEIYNYVLKNYSLKKEFYEKLVFMIYERN